MSAVAATPVRLTRHAIDRYRQRVGVAPARVIVDEVADAVEAGRVACRKPAFLGQKRIRNHGRGRIRFAWPESRDRAYVIRRHDDAVVVLTVEVPQ